MQGKLDDAVAAYREAIRRKPDDALAHFHLAGVLRASGDAAGSLAMLRKGHELNMAAVARPSPGRRVMYPSGRWLEDLKKPPIYDPQADPNAQIATALARAKRANKHVILQFGGNWCDWCYKLLDVFLNNKDVHRMLSSEFELVLIESSHEGVRELVEDDYGGDLAGLPYLLVLDADGKLVRRQPTDELEDAKNGRHDPAKIKQFLKKSAPPRDAEAILAAALATASSQGKRVFLHFGASWSDSEDRSHLLDDFLRRPDIRQILARGFVDVNIQVDRMTGSKGLLADMGEMKTASRGRPSWMRRAR